MDADVVVVGGGCAGFFAARELAEAGLTVVMVGKPEIKDHATSKNFGWLQSGALELASGKSKYAKECMAGAARIQAEFPAAVHRGAVPHGVFFFPKEDVAETFATDCRNLGLPEEDVESGPADKWIPQARSDQAAVRTPDTVFTPSMVMQQLAEEVLWEHAVRFVSHPRPETLDIVQTDSGVQVRDQDDVIVTAARAVQALGVQARTVPSADVLRLRNAYVTRYTMFVASRVVAEHVIAGPFSVAGRRPGFLIPHPEAGRTIMLTGFSLVRERDEPVTLPNIEDARNALQFLWEYFPWLPAKLRGEFYVCHRFKSDGAIVKTEGHITAFYPGYFCVAPHAAKRVADAVKESLIHFVPYDGGSEPPLIAITPTKYMISHQNHRLARSSFDESGPLVDGPISASSDRLPVRRSS